MTAKEREAVIAYLEFHLLTFVEKFEGHCDPLVFQSMYEESYKILMDVERTLEHTNDILLASQKKGKTHDQ